MAHPKIAKATGGYCCSSPSLANSGYNDKKE
nr:MAG TPA: hypothetical protein [Caudoviricetes sp.]